MARGHRTGEPNDTQRRINVALMWADMSGKELAKALQISYSTFKRRMKDGYLKAADLEYVAKVCDVPIGFLVHGWEGCTTWDELDGGPTTPPVTRTPAPRPRPRPRRPQKS